MKSMSTSLNVEDETTGCLHTTGLTVLSWIAFSPKLEFLQSREKRLSISLEWDVFSEQTTGLSVLSWSGFGFGWLNFFGLLNNLSLWSLSNFWTQFLHPIMFHGNIWRKSRWRKYFHVYDFSSFHPNNFRDTISWECFVKNDSVRSCLKEQQSFLLSKFDVDPIHSVLMFLPCFMHELCKTRCSQVDCLRILVFLIHRTHRKKEYCLSVAQILSSESQSWIGDVMYIDCTSDMMNVLEETVRNNDIVL